MLLFRGLRCAQPWLSLEQSALDLVACMTHTYPVDEQQRLQPHVDALLDLLENKLGKSLTLAVARALDALFRRVSSSLSGSFIFLEQVTTHF